MSIKEKNHLLLLIDKLFKGDISEREVENLSNFFSSYQKSSEWPFEKEGKKDYKEEIYSKIQLEIAKRDKIRSKIVPFYKRSLLKYAAAILILITSGYFFLTRGNKTVIDVPVIVDTIIKPGINKATLTLEDGSQIVLEKGESLQTQNANSNGEEIIYKDNQDKVKEIVYNYLTIPRGGQFFIKLSDGTQVWLNSESQLKYPVNFKKGETREVELVYGEAYFEVSPSTSHKGSKFIVFNQSQEIEVLGTKFNIKAYKDELNIYTTLVEGKVLVSTETINQILKPNEQANFNFNDGTISVAEVNVYNEISWKEGVFSFRRKPLKEIMRVLSRWYDIDVIFVNPEIEKAGFNGVLDKWQNLEDILKSIKNFGIIEDYKINNKTVILK